VKCMSVPDQTMTGGPGMRPCTPLVTNQGASVTGVALVLCVYTIYMR